MVIFLPQVFATDNFAASDALTFDNKYTTILEVTGDLPSSEQTYDLASAPVQTRYIVFQRRDKDELMELAAVELLGFLQ